MAHRDRILPHDSTSSLLVHTSLPHTPGTFPNKISAANTLYNDIVSTHYSSNPEQTSTRFTTDNGCMCPFPIVVSALLCWQIQGSIV